MQLLINIESQVFGLGARNCARGIDLQNGAIVEAVGKMGWNLFSARELKIAGRPLGI